jgi:hypothetical protein
MCQSIKFNREQFTIEGNRFDNPEILERTASVIGSNKFEGFPPTPKTIEIIRDYALGLISLLELIQIAITRSYE